MENEFQYLSDRGGHGGHLAEKFLKKYCSYPEFSRLPYRDLPVITRQQLAISVLTAYLKTRFFDLQMLIT